MEPGSSPQETDSAAPMLRDTARRFFAGNWPPERAVSRAQDPAEINRVWRAMAAQGWLALGADAGEGGLEFACILLGELGRAACPAPLLDAFLANVVLSQDASPGVAPLLQELHGGSAAFSCALEPIGSGAGVAALRIESAGGQARVRGRAAYAEGTSIATHILALTGSPLQAAIVPARAPGVAITATPGLAVPPLAEIEFDGAAALETKSAIGEPRALAALARLGLAARALGAAQRGFELVTDYAKVRVQFGRKIGQYQAIQHKLANCLIDLEASRLALDRAAAAFDRRDAEWIYAAGCALSIASPALQRVCLETHHAFGGVSFWEEHEMPRHFRRIHADLARCGGVHAAREDVARYLLDR